MKLKKSSITEVLEDECKDIKEDAKFYQNLIKDIFIYISKHENMPPDQKASQIQKIIDKNV